MKEIAATIRQITSSVSYLPLLEGPSEPLARLSLPGSVWALTASCDSEFRPSCVHARRRGGSHAVGRCGAGTRSAVGSCAERCCGAESDPRNIAKSNIVKLRSFSTTVHTVEAAVAYKATDDDAS